jgi:hypothetical protein
MVMVPQAQPTQTPRMMDVAVMSWIKTMPAGGAMNKTMLSWVSIIFADLGAGSHHPRNADRPMTLRVGLMMMRRVMIQTAREHLNSFLRSLALKWSSHVGSFLPVDDEGSVASTKYGFSTVSGVSSTCRCFSCSIFSSGFDPGDSSWSELDMVKATSSA